MALTVGARTPRSGWNTSVLIRCAALCAAAGVGLSITDYASVGKWLAVIGVLSMIFGLHRFGRTGPDEAIVFQLEPLKKKRKKKPGEPPAVSEPPAPVVPPESESSDGL